MKPVKVQSRFQCDFCKYRSIKSAVERHEKVCFRNPNRYCSYCENKGYTEGGVDIYSNKVPCIYCSKFNPKMKEEIEAREKKILDAKVGESLVASSDIPF